MGPALKIGLSLYAVVGVALLVRHEVERIGLNKVLPPPKPVQPGVIPAQAQIPFRFKELALVPLWPMYVTPAAYLLPSWLV